MDVAELREVFLFKGLTDAQLRELLESGEEYFFVEGQEIFKEGDPADCWWVLLEGQVHLVRLSGREAAVHMMTMDTPGQWGGGFHSWDETSSYLATARGVGAGRMLRVPSWALADLTSRWFPFGVHLIKGFFQTVRRMDTLSREREKLIGLGEMAATFRHEINNPAAAATRAVDALRDTFNSSLSSLLHLASSTPVGAQFTALDALRNEIPGWAPGSDAMAVADRENTLIDWLDSHGVENSWELAPPLASAGVDVAWCERAASILDGPTLGPGLEWMARTVATQSLLSEIKDSTGRVSALVEDMGSYTQLDRAPVQMIDVTEGIESTLRMLDPKLRGGITVNRDYGSDVPEIEAMPAKLNQVWTNLIVNAVDAMEGSGTLRISTRLEGDEVIVEIADTGPGMPVEVQARAFDPFFTTKDVGKGTGLGLDVSRRFIVDEHHGHINIEMRPGETVLCVRLPLSLS